jgi:hypothetical protein
MAVEAWRSKVDDRFDFAIGDVRLEVKASSVRQRVHNFSLEQCHPPYGTIGILVSVFTETSGGGLSLLELVERVENQVRDRVDLVLKVQEAVADSLGSSVASALTMRFDEDVARSSLCVYEIESIPAVREPLPPEISQVRFRSDISCAPPADVAALVACHRGIRALLPKRV